MGENGGDDREQRDEISLLTEEFIQLSVKGSKVVPTDKPTLICTIWTEKFYNPESFKAQMKSLWKIKNKFEIQTEDNLFLIAFETDEDLELIMEGRPWLFQKSLMLFDRITQSVERSQIRLNSLPVWLKVGPCLPKFDKKNLLHAIGVTFGGIIRSKINGEWCRLKINLDVQKPLQRGIFVSVNNKNWWISLKYEKLPTFCFRCGGSDLDLIDDGKAEEAKNWLGMAHGELLVNENKEMKQEKEDSVMSNEQVVDKRSSQDNNPHSVKKSTWRRVNPALTVAKQKDENCNKKRKATEEIAETYCIDAEYEVGTKRLKKIENRNKEKRWETLCNRVILIYS
ncbi:hypothetical protein GOBAR_DD14226 [Gossypium barbadense]|nr:hypothetical protein GOBAR_DD14226 [Gossypium barbadense]